MLTLLTIATAAYMSRRIHLCNEDGTSSAAIDHQQIWTDLIAMFALIGTVCNWAIDLGRNARTYFDAEILPWLDRHGVSVSLPTIDLPALPWGQTEAQAEQAIAE